MSVEPTTALTLDRYQHIVVLTGAGISVASGPPTFRVRAVGAARRVGGRHEDILGRAEVVLPAWMA